MESTTSTPGFWVCGKCGRRVPGRVDTCRCGEPAPSVADGNVPAAEGTPADTPALSSSSFALRIVLALVVFGGLGAGWYAWTKNSADDRNTSMMQTAAAISQRVRTNAIATDAAPQAVATQTSAPAAAPAAAGNTAPMPLEDLVARVAPAVVLVLASGGRGSGFFVDSETVITNAHVVGSDNSVRIKRVNGDTDDARVERVATDLDLAILKTSSRVDQTALVLGSNAAVRSGQDVVAIGSPLGTLQTSVTRGIVSAVRTNGTLTMIQTDAAINPGNSGGPLMDRTGTVIGINSYGSRNTQGIAFAIAVDHARDLLSGSHITSTTATPLTVLNDATSGKSEGERTRESAQVRYERALAQVARRADNLDISWRRFRGDCYRGSIIGSYDREWFALFDRKAMQGAVSPGCGGDFTQEREEAFTIKNTVDALDEAARREDIYPGIRRDLRRKYRLEWDR